MLVGLGFGNYREIANLKLKRGCIHPMSKNLLYMPQPVQHFAKEHYGFRMSRALKEKHVKEFIRALIRRYMDHNQRMRFNEPTVCVISDLTGLEKKTIREFLREMAEDGEIHRPDRYTVIVNPMIANKQAYEIASQYEGLYPVYDDADEQLFDKLKRLETKMKIYYTEGKVMNLSQELSNKDHTIKELRDKILKLEGRLEGQRDVFRMGLSTAINSSMDKVDDILERHEKDGEPAAISIVKDGKVAPVTDIRKYEPKH